MVVYLRLGRVISLVRKGEFRIGPEQIGAV
jgi:hypothetical protein